MTVTVAAADCTGGTVVTDPGSEPALVSDCEALLTLRDALAGTATLDWSEDTAISSWDGVTVGGTPMRVTALDLEGLRLAGGIPPGLGVLTGLEELLLGINRLTGRIPVELGDLSNLRKLYLRYNRLTGSIPRELGDLSNLTVLWLHGNLLTGEMPPELGDLTQLEQLWLVSNLVSAPIPEELGALTELEQLRLQDNELSGNIPRDLVNLSNLSRLELKGNSLEGCVPPSLHRVGINDLASLGLSDCAESGRVPAPSVLSATLADGTFTITWSAVTGAARYEAQHRVEGADDDWASLPVTDGTRSTFSPEDGPICGSSYEFRVRSYGDASTYAAGWSVASGVKSVTTDACTRDPEFDPASYDFEVSEDASTGDAVGTVSATDPDEGDAVAYSITAGNEAGKFDIDEGTGEITVATSITSAAGATYTLTVEASDGREGTATATATITVTAATCSGGIAVPDPGSNPSLVGDCETLLGLRDALAGDATLNWGYGAAMTSWDGVTVGGTPMRVTELDLHIRGLTGSIPAELGDLSNLQDLDLHSNRLTGGIPTELGDLSNLNALWLHNNELRGPIPTELGSLSNLVWLVLSGNGLSGEIPAQLGGLTDLAHLWLQKNQLSGAIPSEIGALTSMQILRLQDNQLSGPIPWELGNLSSSLSILHLSGNRLEGCVPPPLRSVGSSDLGELGLPYCAEEGPVPAPESLSVTLTDGAFSLTWSDVTGAGRYEAQYRIGGTEDDWASAATTTATVLAFSPDGGPVCGTGYEFRVRAYGDGATYVAGWGAESEPAPVTTGPCNRDPEFDPDSYTFSVSEAASTGDTVGTVSATDPDEGDTVSYSITAGNGDGKFMIDGGTGEITVNAALDYEATVEYRLTVEASDERGGTDTATVTVTVTDVAEDPPPVPTGLTVSLADGVFSLTWDAVTGAAKYEAQWRTDAADAVWTALTETTTAATTYTPAGGPACGTEYQFRVRAYGDGETYGEVWGQESAVEPMETPACNQPPRVRPELLRLLHPRERRDEHRSGHRLGHGPGPERHGELRHHGGELLATSKNGTV